MNKEIKLEERNYVAEYRADEKTGLIEGVPIVFDKPADIAGMFQETIMRGAIDEEKLKDVRFFWNHNVNEKAIARTVVPLDKLGGMELKVEEDSVKMKARPNRKRTDANDLYLAIEDGTVDGMSFMFGVREERWEDLESDYPKRYITKIDPIVEVSAVNFAAYNSTSINARKGDSSEKAVGVLEKARKEQKAEAERSAKQKAELELLKEKLKYLS